MQELKSNTRHQLYSRSTYNIILQPVLMRKLWYSVNHPENSLATHQHTLNNIIPQLFGYA
jgi:hypothetical protein